MQYHHYNESERFTIETEANVGPTSVILSLHELWSNSNLPADYKASKSDYNLQKITGQVHTAHYIILVISQRQCWPGALQFDDKSNVIGGPTVYYLTHCICCLTSRDTTVSEMYRKRTD